MVLLGVLGLCQAALLPGLALVALFPAGRAERLSAAEILSFGFALSLAFNYLAVWLLTWAGLNVPASHFALTAASTLVIARALVARRPWGREVLAPIAATSLAGLVALAAWYLVASKASCVFRGGDELLSWNAWATQWAGNALPSNTRHYPQLLPAAWSVIYQFLPTPIDFFAKALMPLFTAGIGATFLAFSRLEKRPWPLYAIPVALLLIYNAGWRGAVMTMGLADVPSAFTLLAAYYAYTKWREDPADGFYLFFSGVLAGAAAATKQGGLALLPYFAAAFLVRAASAALRGARPGPSGARLSAWLPFWFALGAVGLSWYAYAELQVSAGRNHYDQAETWLVNNGTTFFQPEATALGRLTSAYHLLAASLHGQPVVLGLAALCLSALRDRRHRAIIALMAFGYPAVWGLFLSYDLRNLLPAAPFIALGAGLSLSAALRRPAALARARLAALGWSGLGWSGLGERLAAALPTRGSVARAGALGAVLGLGLLWAARPEAKVLESLRRVRAAYIGDSTRLNAKLYAYFDTRPPSDAFRIASYYPFLSAMPGLSERSERVDLRRQGALESVLQEPAVGYLLLVFNLHWHTSISDDNLAAVKRLEQEGLLEEVFRIPDGWLLRKRGVGS